MPLTRPFVVSIAVLIAPLPLALAQTAIEVSWGTSVFEQKIILSDGSVVDPANLIIEIGSFDSGFVPNRSNMGGWLSHWRIFDAVTDTDPSVTTTDADPADSFTNESGGEETARFGGVAHLLGDTTSDSEDATPGYTWSAGEQAYLFIRTSDVFTSTSEWLLVTSTNDSQHVGDSIWQFPDVTGGQPQFSEAWWVADADKAVFGGLAGSAGPGSYTDGSSDYSLRLHKIPEPGPALLGLTTAIFLLRGRRRR